MNLAKPIGFIAIAVALMTAIPPAAGQGPSPNSATTDGPRPPALPPTKSDPMITTALATSSGACIEPEPVFGIEDYNGPFQKLVVHVAGKPDIKTVHAPHSKPGSVLCSLHPGE